jgi:hypothetical protein
MVLHSRRCGARSPINSDTVAPLLHECWQLWPTRNSAFATFLCDIVKENVASSASVWRPARAGLVEQAITAILQKSAARLANGVFVEPEFGCQTDLVGIYPHILQDRRYLVVREERLSD